MRLLLLMATLGLGGAAAYFGTLGKSSYSAYSREQLQVLEEGFNAMLEPTEEQQFSRALLETEKRRRIVFPSLIAAAVLAAIGAYVVRGVHERFGGASPEEAARFSEALGDPRLVLEGAKNQAAALLGVTRTAPPEVIEAALGAQLQSHDPRRLAGLAPDLKAMVLAKREALIQARDLLINGPS